MKSDLMEQCRSCILGHALAAAVGVPVEFMDWEELDAYPVTDMRAYGTHNQPMGAWSDDTSMTLAALDSLTGGLDYDDIMEKFCAWKEHAAYTAGGCVFDMGISTHEALCRFRDGEPPLQCGGAGSYDNGNGPLCESPRRLSSPGAWPGPGKKTGPWRLFTMFLL